MKTLADLKRDAATGKMSMELMERYGKWGLDIPESMCGIRKVLGCNTVALTLLNQDGKKSELRFVCANLLEYDGQTLTVYEAGLRELNESELAVLDGAQKIRDQYAKAGSSGYWQLKEYFRNSPCPWMCGDGFIHGKRYEYSGKVRDRKIKGDVILKYTVYFDGVDGIEDRYIEICEGLGWSVTVCSDDETVELEKSSPAGEDFIITVDKEDFVENVKEYAASFDQDEHIEMWVAARKTTRGVPSIKELVEDAQAIDDMLRELSTALSEAEPEEAGI